MQFWKYVISSQLDVTRARQAENLVCTDNDAGESRSVIWEEKNALEVPKMIVDVYERIIFWKENLFILPAGAVAKLCISEITDLMNSLTYNSLLKMLFSKQFMWYQAYFSKSQNASKLKDHWRALRIDIWKLGKSGELLFEDETIQQRLKITNTPKSIGELSIKFSLTMEKWI